MTPATAAVSAAATRSSGKGRPDLIAHTAVKAPTAMKALLPIETRPAVPIRRFSATAPITASRQVLRTKRWKLEASAT